MANFYSVLINLTSVGYDAGPFDILYSTDGGISFNTLQNNVPASSFTGTGYLVTNLPDDAELVQITSNGVCSNSIITQVDGYPTNCSGTTTTAPPCDCNVSCCVFLLQSAIIDADYGYTACDGTSVISSFSLGGRDYVYVCAQNNSAFCPDGSVTYINCFCNDDMSLEYNINTCSLDTNYEIEIYRTTFGTNIYTDTITSGLPLLCPFSGQTNIYAGEDVKIELSAGTITNPITIEVLEGATVISTSTLNSGQSFLYILRGSVGFNYRIEVYD